uniref:Uncharacterized protein n=1 Tax=Opuntia streptacantha TaxID=393608 RepID=A0A7C9EUJ6_OPUST
MKSLRRSHTSSSKSSSSSPLSPHPNSKNHHASSSPSSSSPSSSSSSWVHLRSVLFVVGPSSSSSASSSSSSSSASSDRGHLKSPWSRRRRKHVLTPQQWRSLFTPDGKLRDGGIKLLKKVRSGVSCLVSLLIGRTVLTPFKYKIIKALFYFVIKYSCKL